MKDQIETINPATAETIRSYDIMDTEAIKRITQDARGAFGKWKNINLRREQHTCEVLEG